MELTKRERDILLALYEAKEELSFSEIGRQIDSFTSNLQKQRRHLEELGLVESRIAGRVRLLKLTKEGKNLARAYENLEKKETSIITPETRDGSHEFSSGGCS